jgi:hypothetical protein
MSENFEFEQSPGKWTLKNSSDIRSLADKLDGKLTKFENFDGHSGERFEFPSRSKAKNFETVLTIFSAYDRLLYTSSRWWNEVLVTYRNASKDDEINNHV